MNELEKRGAKRPRGFVRSDGWVWLGDYWISPEKLREKKDREAKKKRERIAADAAFSERKKAIKRAHYERNKDKLRLQKRQYRKENPDLIRERNRAYTEKAKETPRYKAMMKRKMEAAARKIRESPILRMMQSMSACARKAMKAKAQVKSSRTFELIGCTGAELAAHIEKQFKRGMSWKNYGSAWHVDHITPLSYFDMSNPDDQRRAWNWQNLRPLPAIQNITEGNRRQICQTVLPLTLT